MFTDAETEITGLREVPPLQFVFLNLQPSLENFFGFWPADGDVDSNFLITADAECSDGVASFAYERTSKQSQRIDSIAWSSRRPEAKNGDLILDTYCIQESDHSAAQALWQHESIYHRIRRLRY